MTSQLSIDVERRATISFQMKGVVRLEDIWISGNQQVVDVVQLAANKPQIQAPVDGDNVVMGFLGSLVT